MQTTGVSCVVGIKMFNEDVAVVFCKFLAGNDATLSLVVTWLGMCPSVEAQ